MPIPDIFLKHGEDAFRSAETGILTKFADGIQNNRRCDRPLVLSTGGGTALRKENGLLLRRIGIVVCLVTTPETICKRVSKHVEQRPLLAPYRNALLPRIVQLLDERMPRYEQVANIVVNTARFRQPFEVADHIMTLTDDLEEQCAQVS